MKTLHLAGPWGGPTRERERERFDSPGLPPGGSLISASAVPHSGEQYISYHTHATGLFNQPKEMSPHNFRLYPGNDKSNPTK